MTVPAPQRRAPRRGGRLITPLLLVAGSILTALAMLAGWAQWQLLDTGAFRETSGGLLEREEIRDRVAEFLVREVQASAGPQPPPEVAGLSDRAVARQLGTARSERVWRAASGETHRELVRLIEDGEATSGDVVVLDLRRLLRSVAGELGLPVGVVPPGVARVEIVAGNQVRGAREGADQLQRAAVVLLLAAPLVLLLGVLAATGWRLRALAGAGVAIAAAGAVVLLMRTLVGSQIVDVLTSNSADRGAAAAAWSVITGQLAWIAALAIVAGLVLAAGATVADRQNPTQATYL